MAAKFDRVQGFKFYYGNAAQDLNSYLPKEEAFSGLDRPSTVNVQVATSIDTQMSSQDLSALSGLVDGLESKLQKIEASQAHLSFLISDLKRIIA